MNYKTQLDEIEKSVYAFLKPLGFKKKGRTFNRETERGIYQVINLQRSQNPENFTVNMGVFIEEIFNLEQAAWNDTTPPKVFYSEYECHLRLRLGRLVKGADYWWSMEKDSIENISSDIIEGLNLKGLDWFDRFSTRERIIQNWGEGSRSCAQAKLIFALMVLISDKEKGALLLSEYVNGLNKASNNHKGYILELASRLGVKI